MALSGNQITQPGPGGYAMRRRGLGLLASLSHIARRLFTVGFFRAYRR